MNGKWEHCFIYLYYHSSSSVAGLLVCLEIIPLGSGGCSSIPRDLSAVETYTLLAVTKHGIQSNKIPTLGSNLATGWGRKLQRSCGVWE